MTLPQTVQDSLEIELYGNDQQRRQALLLPALSALTEHHLEASVEYRQIVEALFPDWREGTTLESLPWLPVGIFKKRYLASVEASEVYKTITSSGTTGQMPSRIAVDKVTARRQTKALSLIVQSVIGPKRLPMMVIDSKSTISDPAKRSARAAGVVGLMTFGRRHQFLLDDDMEPLAQALIDFAEEHQGKPKLMFGFTFMVWKYLMQALGETKVDLSGTTLFHSGGWKKMEQDKVSPEEFNRSLEETFGIDRIVNFYGMAEQVGAIFIESSGGLLHPCGFSDVIIRDPQTWQEAPVGQEGLIQVMSAVPTSYPGHSILTEDLGVIESVDNDSAGFGGKAFRVLGRLPKSELRGCSDTFAQTLGA